MYDYQFKVMLLGDSGVGKTCLLMRFSDEIFFSDKFFSTIGIDHRSKIVNLGEKKINLQIFDTAGQEKFYSLSHSYYRDADAFLLLYDVTSYSSFDNINSWLNQIKHSTNDEKIIMLIGNKIDKSQRVVSRQLAEHYAQLHRMNILETSAKTGQNVELAFMTTAQDLIDKYIVCKSSTTNLNSTTSNHSSCC